jgi:acyl dehydratase
MRAFEDFMVGEVMLLGPVAVTAEDIKSFAERFDPRPMHLDDNAEQNPAVSGIFASGMHIVCMHMRLFAEGVLNDSTSMGSLESKRCATWRRFGPATASHCGSRSSVRGLPGAALKWGSWFFAAR